MSKVGSRLISAAKEARLIARGEKEPISKFIPADIDVKSIRSNTGMSQEDFAATFGFTVNQIRDWEQQRSRPIGGLRAYLLLIQSCPEQLAEMLANAIDIDGGEKAA